MLELGTSPIDIKRLKIWLKGYEVAEQKYLLNGFRKGFGLQYSGQQISYESKNLKSAILNPKVLEEKLIKEVELGRILGPFNEKPFSNLRVNPLGLVPKKSGGWRLITNLSHPIGNGVNDFIDSKYCSVHYSKFDNVIEKIQILGKGTELGKQDISSAFNLCPIRPEDFPLLGIKYKNRYWIQKMLPQGASISCAIFERFSSFIQWAFSNYTKSSNIDHYLDDFIFLGKSGTKDCSKLMSDFKHICDDMNIPLNPDKSEGPVTVLTYLGFVLDTDKLEVRIPSEKIEKAKDCINEIIHKKKVRLNKFQSVVGLLNFFTRVIPSGRTFNCGLYRAMSQAKRPNHFIRISSSNKEDLMMWLHFLEHYNGISVFSNLDWVSDNKLHLYTDSAGNRNLACGAYLDGEWSVFKWPECWGDEIFKDITFLELIPIVLSFYLWDSKLKGKKIIIHTDNQSLVQIINNKSSRNNRVMILMRQLVLKLLLQNIQIKAVHIESKENGICDAISRLQYSRLLSLLPHNACKVPLSIPQDFQHFCAAKLTIL